MDDREVAVMLEAAGWRHLNNDPAWVKNLGGGVLTVINLGRKEYQMFGPLSDLPLLLSHSPLTDEGNDALRWAVQYLDAKLNKECDCGVCGSARTRLDALRGLLKRLGSDTP